MGVGEAGRRGGGGLSEGGHPASVTAQAVVLRKIRTSSLY